MKNTVLIKQDISGKLRNLKLSPADFLFPLFEMVVNSVQSIHARGGNDGRIDIMIGREKQGIEFQEKSILAPIESFTIEDNGVGFTDENFESFCTADSPHKIDLGCKGVGRFVALKAFERIVIDSKYLDVNANKVLMRELLLSQKDNLISSEPALSVDEVITTSTKLENYLPDFRSSVSVSAVARKLLEHCLIYYINGNAPEIYLHDNDITINLAKLYKDFIQQDEVIDSFELKSRRFEIFYIKKYTDKGKHQLHYCANDREVLRKQLSKLLPDLKEMLADERGKYYLSIYVKSSFLDERVYAERNLFSIPDTKSKKKLFDIISFEEIEAEIIEKIKENYSEELKDIANAKKQELQVYVYRDGLEYRHLLEHEELLELIPPGLTDDRLDTELHKINHKLEKQQKARVNQFLSNRNPVEDHAEYQEELRKILSQEQDFTQSKLATYLTRRKVIIKVLDRLLGLQKDGTYVYEKEIHNIIFPRFKDSKSVSYKEHNLWVLDERLTYHQYISSDNAINQFTDGDSDKEPDLILFDKRFAFGENDYSSVVIFEFKRPMRKLAGKEKNAHEQVIDYVQDLMKTNAKDFTGRYNKITAETPKFGFIICDYDKDLEDHLIQFADFIKTPKGTLFLYKKGINFMIEVMDYKTLIEDVEMRHKAFFREMGIDRF